MDKEKMRKIFIIAVLASSLLLSSLAFRGEIKKENDEWNKEYGARDIAAFLDIKQIEDGYILCGAAREAGTMNDDGWIVKIDKEGNKLWEKFYGGKNQDELWCILEVEDGYVAAGTTESFGNGSFDCWLLKIDKEGNEIWNKTYGWKEDDFASKVIKGKDGGYLIVGGTATSPSPYTDILLVKTDENGNVEWYKTFDGIGKDGDIGDDIIEVEDGYLIAGSTVINITERFDVWLIKIDKNGNEIWNKTYGWEGGGVAKAAVRKIEDGYAIAGYVCLWDMEVPSGYLIKVDKEGNEIWKKCYPGTSLRESNFIIDFEVIEEGYILYGGTGLVE